jgi:hypothetical protein
VFTFIFAWNDYIFALVLTRTEVMTFTVQATGYFGAQSTLWAPAPYSSVRHRLVLRGSARGGDDDGHDDTGR